MADPFDIDASTAIYNLLRTGDFAADLRELVVGEADGVYEAGDLTPSVIASAEGLRQNDSPPAQAKALAVAVQDAGSSPMNMRTERTTVTVRVYDRLKGYRNIRAVRQELIRLLHGFVANVIADGGESQGVLNIEWIGRTGHRYDSAFAVEYEAVSFIVTIEHAELD